MAKPENKEVKTAADLVRKLLFNYDLCVTASKGELQLAKAKTIRYKNPKNKKESELYTSARIDEIKLQAFIDQLTDGKNETWKSLEGVLETYTPRYKQIWLMYFISQLSYQEIAEQTNYSIDGVNNIIQKLKKDLIDLNLVAKDGESDGNG